MRAHRTLIVSLILALILAVPAGAAAKRLIIGGSTSVLPLMQKLATAYHKAYPKIPAPQVSGGQSDIGISGAANGRFDIGDSSRDPIIGVDPTGLVFTKIARDGVCVITNDKNPISNLSQQEVEGIFTGQDPRLERSAGREGLRPDRPVRPRRRLRYRRTPSSTSSSAKPEDLAERDRRDLQRPRAAARRKGRTRDRLRVLRLHRRRQRRRLPGRRVQPAQRPLRPVRGRA